MHSAHEKSVLYALARCSAGSNVTTCQCAYRGDVARLCAGGSVEPSRPLWSSAR